MAPQLIILHTNDIHGRVEGIARVASLVEQTRAANPGIPVLYFDVGDIEDPGADWEFESYSGHVDPAWRVAPRCELPTILREALEEHLATHRPVDALPGRLEA